MNQLATLAGVSAITVSRALKDSPLVKPETRDQIRKLAREHGYRLNTAARNLRLMRNHTITAVIEMIPSADRTMSDPIILAALGGLLQTTTSAGYRLILTTLTQLLQTSNDDTDGIILLGQGSSPEALKEVVSLGLPLVVWGTPGEADGDWLTVGSDNHHGGRLIGEHLQSIDRRRILFLGDDGHPEVSQRLAGLRAGVGKAEIVQRRCDFSVSAGARELAAALAEGWGGDAVVAASDAIALGAMAALAEAGRAVPTDVAVTGFDGIPASATAAVPLTTVRQEWERAGELIGSKMLQWIASGRPQAEQLPVELVVRASTSG